MTGIQFVARFLKQIDIYGQKVQLSFKKDNSFTTAFGGCITLSIFLLFCIGCWFFGKELYLKKNPYVISSERPVADPKRIEVSPSNLIIMMAISSYSSTPFIDPTIFQVRAVQEVTQQYTDPVTGITAKQLVDIPKSIRPCTSKDIGLPDLQSYFSKVNYPLYYCLDSSQSEVFIEGDFDAPSFSQIYVYFEKCQNSTSSTIICKPEDQINKALQFTKVLISMSDHIVDPLNFAEPIIERGITLYSITSSTFPQEMQFFFTNQYIETDVGVFTSQIETTHSFMFVQQTVLPFFADTNVLVRLLFRLQKQKENLMQRSYLKLAEAIAQIGGLLKILTTVGAIITYPICKLYLFKAIVDEVFSFESVKQVQLVDKSTLLSIHEQKSNSSQLITPNSIKKKNIKPLVYKEEDCKLKSISRQDLVNSSTTPQTKHKLNMTQTQVPSPIFQPNAQGSPHSINQDEQNGTMIANFEKKLQILLMQAKSYFTYTHQIIKYKFFHYFTHSFLPKIKQIRNQRALLDEGVSKIQDHLDVLFILNKLLEIDKIKSTLLNSNQLKLFEYIPRPLISDKNDEITNQKEKSKEYISENVISNQQIQANNPDNIIQSNTGAINEEICNNNNNIHLNSIINRKHSDMNKSVSKIPKSNTQRIYQTYCEAKSDCAKANEAYDGLQEIFKQNKLSKIDENLVNLIDPSLLDSFLSLKRSSFQYEDFNLQNSLMENSTLKWNKYGTLKNEHKKGSIHLFSLKEKLKDNIYMKHTRNSVNSIFQFNKDEFIEQQPQQNYSPDLSYSQIQQSNNKGQHCLNQHNSEMEQSITHLHCRDKADSNDYDYGDIYFVKQDHETDTPNIPKPFKGSLLRQQNVDNVSSLNNSVSQQIDIQNIQQYTHF